jgi:hypothetical protein
MPSLRPAVLALGGFFLIVAGTILGGCDGSGSKRSSLFERLTRTSWMIERLEGPGISPNRLDRRYERVRIDFGEREGKRTYRITGRFSADSTEVLAKGLVFLPPPSDDVLRMASGFGRDGPVTWTFEFEASRAIFAVQVGSRPFLRRLFPNTTWSRQVVTMTLAPDDE